MQKMKPVRQTVGTLLLSMACITCLVALDPVARAQGDTVKRDRTPAPSASAAHARPEIQPPIDVAVFLYPNVVLQDFAGPIEVFTKARGLTRGAYRVYTFSQTTQPVSTEGGSVTVTPDYAIEEMPEPDIVIVPGAPLPVMDELRDDESFLALIKEVNRDADVVMSVCTGAYLLGEAGLLDGLRSTTHYFVADDFQSQYPHTRLVKDVRYVDESHVVTTSGITSGIDGALHLVEKYSGPQIAHLISNAMQYVPHRSEEWPTPVDGMTFDRGTEMRH